MPSIIYRGRGASDWPEGVLKNKNGDVGYYALPPVQYENGKYLHIILIVCWIVRFVYLV